MTRKCFSCYFYADLDEKKGFCYKKLSLPEPSEKNAYCSDWSPEDKEAGLFEI